jgi:hypothetical protein
MSKNVARKIKCRPLMDKYWSAENYNKWMETHECHLGNIFTTLWLRICCKPLEIMCKKCGSIYAFKKWYDEDPAYVVAERRRYKYESVFRHGGAFDFPMR